MILRRKHLPRASRAVFQEFAQVVALVERGKVTLTDSVSSSRRAGRPFADALLEFEEALAIADTGMQSWRRPEVEDAWQAADAGLQEARTRASRLRSDGRELGGFEGLIGLIADLLEPLDAFVDARDALARLRL